MSTYIEHAADWDAQREILSASLDGRLTPAEGEALRLHLPSCPRCTQELAEMRQVVALLRALPQPDLPRSFTLPVARPAAPDHLSRGARRPARWPQVAQWAGGLVAAAGLLIGVAGTVGNLPLATQTSPASAGSAYAPRAADHQPSSASPQAGQPATPSYGTVDGATAPTQPMTPTVVLAPSPTTSDNTSSAASAQSARPAEGLPVLPITSATLLIAGAGTFAAGTRARRHRG
jgi:anti-sigma factor RsiW